MLPILGYPGQKKNIIRVLINGFWEILRQQSDYFYVFFRLEVQRAVANDLS